MTVTNKNKYEICMKHSLVIKITKPDDTFKSYVLMENQLASILYIDPVHGISVIRGRVKEFKYPTLTRTFVTATSTADQYPVDQYPEPLVVERIVLDISKDFHQQETSISPKTILEVNPIDWEYQDIEKVIVDAPINDWHEYDNKVSAPYSEQQYRFGMNDYLGDDLK